MELKFKGSGRGRDTAKRDLDIVIDPKLEQVDTAAEIEQLKADVAELRRMLFALASSVSANDERGSF
jgi:hypothetical protein